MNPHYRRIRLLFFTLRVWRKRLVFWFGAVMVGIVASLFARAADMAQGLFDQMVAWNHYAPFVACPLMMGISAWLTAKYIPGAPGSGIPQAMAARQLRDKESRDYLLGPKVIFGKILLTLVGLLGGASIGREGPSVQVGAGLMLLCANISGLAARRGVVLAGAAAGVSAAFNTPLAGIVFAIEEMARSFEHRHSALVLTAIVLSGAAALSFSGNYDYFGYTASIIHLNRDWLAILVLGVVGGAAGALFTLAVLEGAPFMKKVAARLWRPQPWLIGALCGMIVAVVGVSTHNATFGSGYALGHQLLHGTLETAWWQMPGKFLVTVVSAICGIPGGIFSPSLSVGAALGGSMAGLFPGTAMSSMVLLSMVAYFAGVTQAPITSFVIVLEITGDGTVAVPLIAAAVIASAVARLITPHSLYHALADQFVAQTRRATYESSIC